MLVEEFDCALEAGKLHHGVGNLATPEWGECLVEAIQAFVGHDFGGRRPQSGWEGARGAGLDPHFDRLHGREGDVGKELGRRRGGQIEGGSVEVRPLLAQESRIDVLEDLVEAELADALERVADGGGGPAEEQILGAALLQGHLEPVAEALVFVLVDLQPALDQIQRGHHRVGDAARQEAAEAAVGIIRPTAKLARVAFCTGGCGGRQGPRLPRRRPQRTRRRRR